MNDTPFTRSNEVKAKAHELGFDACGVATVAAIDEADRLGQWLDAGYHADMEWMARTKDIRQDITLKLSGARSVVVVARNYYAPDPPRPAGTGVVARYARGRDYHRALRRPLLALAGFIDEMDPRASSFTCIDSGPVLERSWAARAGIGWVGKNSLVLRPDLGSYFFLAAVATTVELAADTPVADRCGSCRACIDACPTGAIVAPEVVDARRCISYQTIENRGGIPEALHGDMGDWLFGCDVCQEVCPWNRKIDTTSETDFHPRPGQAYVDLDSLEAMDDAAFLDRFAGTPLMRTKRTGLQRNAAVIRASRKSLE